MPAAGAPLWSSYAQLQAAGGQLRVAPGPAPEAGWLSAARLDPQLLAAAPGWNGGGCAPRPDVAATWALRGYVWLVGVLVAAPLLLERRVPLLTPGRLWLSPDGIDRAVLDPSPLYCLPTDPLLGANDRPAALTPVADLAALRAQARRVLVDQLTPVVAGFGPLLRRGAQASWRLVADELVGAVWYVGRVLGRSDWAAAEAGALLPGRTPPLVTAAAFREVSLEDRTALTRTRASCCLFYTLPDVVDCLTCPRVSEAQRLERLRAGEE